MIKKDNSCLGKTAYSTLEKASEAAKSMNQKTRNGKRVEAYKCSLCSLHHFGHNSRGKTLDPKHKKRRVIVDHEPGIHKVKNKFYNQD